MRRSARPIRITQASQSFCVGNIVAGGAGKTPTALAIAELLKQSGARPVFVTRGYGGSERGPLQVDATGHTAKDVGDEALLLARVAPTWVGRDRAAAIRAAEHNASHIIMDDGLQNPHVHPDHALLVIDGESGLGNGHVIPAGPLRETFEEAIKRVAAIVLIGEHDMQNVTKRTQKPVIRARIRPELPADFPDHAKILGLCWYRPPYKILRNLSRS